MVNKVFNLYKKCGETPLECINNLKKNNKELFDLPITYAGRLDPLAEGVLIALIGEECLKKDEYLNLSKEYEVIVLFGFSTDTYDLMGKVLKENSSKNFSLKKVEKFLLEFMGKIDQFYPPYSSRTVKGKPLFQWAREDKLNEIEIPSHQVQVDSIEIIEEDKITANNLLKKIKEVISLVNGDFRQDEIITLWEEILKEKKEEYKIIKLRVTCGSGVYVRSIANDIGELVGVPALAFKIIRTRVGSFKIN